MNFLQRSQSDFGATLRPLRERKDDNVLNDEVSDTTGDAMECKCWLTKDFKN